MSEIVGLLVGDAWGRRRARRRALERLATDGTAESGLRVIEGHVPGLSKEWTHGSWTVSRGRLSFFDVVVYVTAAEARLRQPTVRESWGVSPDAEIVTLRSPTGQVEWALPPGLRVVALQQLLDHSGSGPHP